MHESAADLAGIGVEINERSWPFVSLATYAPLSVSSASRLVVRLTRWVTAGAPFSIVWLDGSRRDAVINAPSVRVLRWWLARYGDELRTCCAGIAIVSNRRPQLANAIDAIRGAVTVPVGLFAECDEGTAWLRAHMISRGWLAYLD